MRIFPQAGAAGRLYTHPGAPAGAAWFLAMLPTLGKSRVRAGPGTPPSGEAELKGPHAGRAALGGGPAGREASRRGGVLVLVVVVVLVLLRAPPRRPGHLPLPLGRGLLLHLGDEQARQLALHRAPPPHRPAAPRRADSRRRTGRQVRPRSPPAPPLPPCGEPREM